MARSRIIVFGARWARRCTCTSCGTTDRRCPSCKVGWCWTDSDPTARELRGALRRRRRSDGARCLRGSRHRTRRRVRCSRCTMGVRAHALALVALRDAEAAQQGDEGDEKGELAGDHVPCRVSRPGCRRCQSSNAGSYGVSAARSCGHSLSVTRLCNAWWYPCVSRDSRPALRREAVALAFRDGAARVAGPPKDALDGHTRLANTVQTPTLPRLQIVNVNGWSGSMSA